MVECDLAKVEVAGSNPVSRSRFLCFQLARAPMTHQLGFGTLFARAGARYPSGKGEVCKTFMRRFDSDPRLQVPLQEQINDHRGLFSHPILSAYYRHAVSARAGSNQIEGWARGRFRCGARLFRPLQLPRVAFDGRSQKLERRLVVANYGQFKPRLSRSFERQGSVS